VVGLRGVDLGKENVDVLAAGGGGGVLGLWLGLRFGVFGRGVLAWGYWASRVVETEGGGEYGGSVGAESFDGAVEGVFVAHEGLQGDFVGNGVGGENLVDFSCY
jgi:hypothetical protein